MITLLVLTIAGGVMAAIVGTLWYSPRTPMGRIHMRYLGFDALSPEEQKLKIEQEKPRMVKLYLGQFLLSLLTAFAVVFVISLSVENGVPFYEAVLFPVMSWLCFMVPAIGTNILWSNCERAIAWKKFFSDIFSNLVIILLVALMTSLFV